MNGRAYEKAKKVVEAPERDLENFGSLVADLVRVSKDLCLTQSIDCSDCRVRNAAARCLTGSKAKDTAMNTNDNSRQTNNNPASFLASSVAGAVLLGAGFLAAVHFTSSDAASAVDSSAAGLQGGISSVTSTEPRAGSTDGSADEDAQSVASAAEQPDNPASRDNNEAQAGDPDDGDQSANEGQSTEQGENSDSQGADESTDQGENSGDQDDEEPADQGDDSDTEEPADQGDDSDTEEPADQGDDSDTEEPAEQDCTFILDCLSEIPKMDVNPPTPELDCTPIWDCLPEAPRFPNPPTPEPDCTSVLDCLGPLVASGADLKPNLVPDKVCLPGCGAPIQMGE